MNETAQTILQRLEKSSLSRYRKKDGFPAFYNRLTRQFPLLLEQLFALYGGRRDFLYQVEDIVRSACKYALQRPSDLKILDQQREQKPDWFLANSMAGISLYVDLFSGSLKGLIKHIPYVKELGITSLHLMPLYKTRKGANDGGYAVSSYRQVNENLGTYRDLLALNALLRENGISLVLDFVLNHTSSDHEWALKARKGIPEYQDYYYIFKDKSQVEEYSPFLRDIFPAKRKGSFSYCDELQSWVWTTFNDYQWDLNYKNPVVFRKMMEEMLFLANAGVEILRFDALAFLWKEKGTGCENLPKVHTLIHAFKSITKIACPAVAFKSEAIVHPDDVRRYISSDECELSYNPLLMATLWESLATRKVSLLKKSMETYAAINTGCSWVNYVRCHDDIGWTFSDADAESIGINPRDHRKFLNEFYSGSFEGSFARGLLFQENKRTGDARVSGTCASLAGMEKALALETEKEVDLAVKRILLLYGIIMSMNGYPLIFAGDEWGLLNDYRYRDDSSKKDDSRWVHRQKFPWDTEGQCVVPPYHKAGEIYEGIRHLLEVRKTHRIFRSEGVEIVDTLNHHVFGFRRKDNNSRLTVIANFSEEEQQLYMVLKGTDILTGKIHTSVKKLKPYEFLWILS